MTRVLLHTFGCKANQYDTEVLRQALESAGATIVARPEDADAAVVNSCTVTHVGEGKLRGFIRRLARRQPGIRTVVVGCAAALDDGPLASLPNVAGVFGGAEPGPVLRTLSLPAGEVPRGLRTFQRGTRAWLKVQDGCDEHCTFCATTLARGANRSRPLEDILAEARVLGAGHAEIVLTGVHIGTYGRDLGPGHSLGHLVECLAERVPDVRFRLSSVEATEVDDRLARLMRTAPDRLAPHLHAPLQSGSDPVLRRMGRHWYAADHYCCRIEALAAAMPVFGLGADVMVGFPGESEADFARTCAVVESLPFTYLHVFPYSERPATSAAKLGRPVEPAAMQERAAILRTLARQKGDAYRRERGATVADVVTLTRAAGWYEGLTEDYLSVRWPADALPPPRFAARIVWESGGTLRACREDAA
jgi:threonylcarbamoyladenosine tRNA methylthiotransferase MtaB